MSKIKEEDIVHEAPQGGAWVWRDAGLARYVVFQSGAVASTSDSAYPLDDDGLSIAKARADYLARRVLGTSDMNTRWGAPPSKDGR